MLFGTKKPDGKTLLMLDVEQGSVGSALVRLNPGEAPRLFGETRVLLHILPTRDAMSLLRETREALRKALAYVAQVGSRLRNAPLGSRPSGILRDIGEISHAAVFLGAPWGTPDFAAEMPAFVASMRETVEGSMEESFGLLPHNFYTAAGGILSGSSQILPQDTYLLCIVGGELSELMLLQDGVAAGYASAPVGGHALVRTLRAHGLSDEESHSALRLDSGGLFAEPLSLAARHWAGHVADAASPLLARANTNRIWVLAHGGSKDASDWFARALTANDNFNKLFPSGGELRALKSSYITPHIAAHAPAPDLRLSLEALYSDTLF